MLNRDTLALKPETSDSFEIGLKALFLDRKLSLNLEAFESKNTRPQASHKANLDATLSRTAVTHLITAGDDQMQLWFENGAADGFNIMPPFLPDGLTDFSELVVPVLQRRGLVRTRYKGSTLRENLGLSFSRHQG